MKKSYIKYLVFFIAIFCFGLINVNATHKCVYGSGTGKDWKQEFVLDIESQNPFYFGDNESPFFTKLIKKGGLGLVSDVAEPIYPATLDGEVYKDGFKGDVINWPDHEEIYFAAKIDDGECPSKLFVAFLFYKSEATMANTALADSFGKYNDNVAFFDEFGEGRAAKFLGFKNTDDEKKSKYIFGIGGQEAKFHWDKIKLTFILKEKKDDPLVLNSCDVYTKYFNDLKETLKDKDGNIDPKRCDNNSVFDKRYAELQESCNALKSSVSYSDSSGTAKGCMTACTNLRDEVDDLCQIEHGKSYCGSLGNGIVNWIFKIIRIIRYAMPPIMIILSVLDFIKAISEEDESKMKEATKRFFRRLIAVALLFIIPFIIDFILHMFNIPGLNASNPFCAK